MITFRQLQRMNVSQIDSQSDLCPITVDGVIRWQLLKVGHHADSHPKLGTNPKMGKTVSGTSPDDSQATSDVKRDIEKIALGMTSDDSQARTVTQARAIAAGPVRNQTYRDRRST